MSVALGTRQTTVTVLRVIFGEESRGVPHHLGLLHGVSASNFFYEQVPVSPDELCLFFSFIFFEESWTALVKRMSMAKTIQANRT